METLLAYLSGLLVAVSVYLMLRRHLLRFFFGLILLSNAVNLIIFSMGRLTRERPPVIMKGSEMLTEPAANALPQALILTAIVISFGLLAFMLALILSAHKELDTLDSDDLTLAETRFEKEPMKATEERP